MEDCDEDVTGFGGGGGGGGEEEVELTVPRGEPLYVENLAGPLTSVPLFQSSILQELQDLEVELAPGSSQFCEEEDISVDELKILSEEELVEMAIKEVLKIVAVANLMPADDSVDELDSYMYQTVGHQIVISYAECMGVPLFRRRIQGSTRHQKLSYRMTPGDEVEDMFILLNEVKRQIPSVTAVSSGAIASDYQRLRVESVCSRLGLVSLAYLWKQDQSMLLQEMISSGIVAITVKVAAMGLDPSKHLGKEMSVCSRICIS